MRIKQLRLILTFKTTTAAMAMEAHCMSGEIPGRLIPVPRAITAGCGTAWSSPPEWREKLSDAAAQAGIEIEGIYLLEI